MAAPWAWVQKKNNQDKLLILIGGEYRNRTGVHGFAIRPLSQENQRGAVSKHAPTNRELSKKVSNADLTGANENPDATVIATGVKDVPEQKENAATFAEVSGAIGEVEDTNLPQNDNPKPAFDATEYVSPAHKAVARAVGYALTVGDADGYAALSDVMVLRLAREERVGLAWAAQKSLEDEDAAALADTIGAGMPVAPYISFMDEAAFWADMAAPKELDAYCLATFNRMTPARRSAFLNYVQGRATT